MARYKSGWGRRQKAKASYFLAYHQVSSWLINTDYISNFKKIVINVWINNIKEEEKSWAPLFAKNKNECHFS